MRYHNENFNGTLDFRCKVRKNWWVELHLHEYSEILYCKGGVGEIYINGRAIELCEGNFVWIPPNYVHRLEFRDAEVICAVFSNDFIPLFFSTVGEKRLVASAMAAGELAPLLEGLPLLQKEEPLKIAGALNTVAARAVEGSRLEAAGITDGVLFQKVVNYISAHYTEDIKLSTLSRLFGYNEKYLSHALHSLTGIHFSSLLAFYRVERAKTLLLTEKEKSITTVALECGFSAINSFHRIFLKHTGMTPHQYRQKNNGRG